MSLPTTRVELQSWLEKQLATQRPDFPASTRWEMVSVVMNMVHSDAEVATFVEGWEAGRKGKPDPERFKSSLEDMKRNGRI